MTYKRNFPDWIKGFIDYAGFGEAPRHMYFWVGASVIAGALRRRVWIDMEYFKWYPNMYVILVAPPGIVSKSTTAGIGMQLLRAVPGIRFGPDVVTWQALVTAFAESSEAFELNGEFYTMSPITIESSEFGNLLNPADKDMVDLLVSLWDGKQGKFEKKTKMSGNDSVENPWINLIACTTPSWIAGNFPEYMIGGGFTSRCVFVYAERKQKYVAYPGLVVPPNMADTRQRLIQDLEHISLALSGPYQMLPAAISWGEAWYQHHYTNRPEGLDDDRFGGYIARKQTHIHKLAMVLAAAQRDELTIREEDLIAADEMVTDLEADMPMVFSKIGRTEESLQVDRFLGFVRKVGRIKAGDAYRFIHSYFPQSKDYEEVLRGAIRAGFVELRQINGELWLVALHPSSGSSSPESSGTTGSGPA